MLKGRRSSRCADSSVLSITYLYFFASAASAGASLREQQEATFLSSAIGMMLGWAWADAVGSLSKAGSIDWAQTLLGVDLSPMVRSMLLVDVVTIVVVAARHGVELRAKSIVESVAEEHERFLDEDPAAFGKKKKHGDRSWTRRFYIGKIRDRVGKFLA